MFDILKTLIDLDVACEAHGTTMRWDIYDEPGRGLVLRVEADVTEDDQNMVRDLRLMFAPVAS